MLNKKKKTEEDTSLKAIQYKSSRRKHVTHVFELICTYLFILPSTKGHFITILIFKLQINLFNTNSLNYNFKESVLTMKSNGFLTPIKLV